MYHWSLGIIHMDLDALVVYGEVLARQCSGSAECGICGGMKDGQ